MSQKFTDWDATASNNTTVGTGAIDIDEGCLPGNVNDALREIMAAAVRSSGLPGLDGTSRPSGVQAGQFWFDTTSATAPIIKFYDGTDDITYATIDYTANTITLASGVGGTGLANIVEDTTPQLGGALDLNGFAITFPGAAVTDVTGSDTLAVSGTAGTSGNLAQWNVDGDLVDSSIAASGVLSNLSEDTTPQLGGDLDLNGNNIDFPTTPNISDVLDEDNMASDSATALATQQSIKAYVDANAGSITPGTVSALSSGTTSDYTSLTSGLNRITIILDQASLNAPDDLLIQLSVSSTFVTTGYTSRAGDSADTTVSTAGFALTAAVLAANNSSGVFTLARVTGNTWVLSGTVDTAAGEQQVAAGRIALAGTLDGVRLTSVAASTFDGGQWNIFTE